MKLNYFTLFAACTSIAFSTAPSSIDGVRTPQDFEAYKRGWYQDGETNPATHLTKFKSPDGNQIMYCAIPHNPCAETLYSSVENVTVHKMRIEMKAGQPWQVVYYAMLNNQKLAIIRETLKDAESIIKISANEVSGDYIRERALALYAIAAEGLTIKQKSDDAISYQVSIQLDIGLRQEEEKIALQLAGIVQAQQFKDNINIIDSFR
jgi:hypothetical protein